MTLPLTDRHRDFGRRPETFGDKATERSVPPFATQGLPKKRGGSYRVAFAAGPFGRLRRPQRSSICQQRKRSRPPWGPRLRVGRADRGPDLVCFCGRRPSRLVLVLSSFYGPSRWCTGRPIVPTIEKSSNLSFSRTPLPRPRLCREDLENDKATAGSIDS